LRGKRTNFQLRESIVEGLFELDLDGRRSLCLVRT
jgi:hypothetical protein